MLLRWLPVVLLLLGVLFTALVMAEDWREDPFDPAMNYEGTEAYGHNGPHGLRRGLTFVAVEAVFLLLLMHPWRRKRSWLVPLLGVGVFGPWMLLSLFSSMHAGGIWILHGLWTMYAGILLTLVALLHAILRLQEGQRLKQLRTVDSR